MLLFFPSVAFGKILPVSIIEIGACLPHRQEFLLLRNNASQTISLKDWHLKENFSARHPNGEKHSFKLVRGNWELKSGQTALLCPDPNYCLNNNFSPAPASVFHCYWSSLKEKGEKIQLLDNQGNIKESFTYPSCHRSLLKKINPLLSGSDQANWQQIPLAAPSSPTPPRAKTSPSSSAANSSAVFSLPAVSRAPSAAVIINEIFPNPLGVDFQKEFIELKNISNQTINLSNWKIANSHLSYTIKPHNNKQPLILPHKFFLLWRPQTNLALYNKKDEVKLYNPQGKLVSQIKFTDAPAGKSYAYNYQHWLWTTTPTPGVTNKTPFPNKPPRAIIEKQGAALIHNQIFFDASDSYDPEGQKIFFLWFFGDGQSSTLPNPIHIYNRAGKYLVKLYVFDQRGAKGTAKLTLNIKGNSLAKKKISIKKTKPAARKKILPKIKHSSRRQRRQKRIRLSLASGPIVALPGMIYKKIFYLNGQAVYFSQKLPRLRLGEKLKVWGWRKKYYGQNALRLAFLRIVGQQPSSPLFKHLKEISPRWQGHFLKIKGRVTAVTKHYLYLDDGTAELKIIAPQLKNFSFHKIPLNSLASAQGIVLARKQKAVLALRQKKDFSYLPPTSSPTRLFAASSPPPKFTKPKFSLKYILLLLFILVNGAIFYIFFRHKE